MYYPPVCACTVAYPKSAFRDIELDNGLELRDHAGFGRESRTRRTLGTLWSSSLFQDGARQMALAELHRRVSRRGHY